MKHYTIQYDHINVSGQLTSCLTLKDVREQLQQLFPGRGWMVYQGRRHVRLHHYPRSGLLAFLIGRGEPEDLFLAVEAGAEL
jgi:hypothetical protein